ncbi:uncharacterized protein RSE6_08161 [Rhynchosporium secalis]|uniref:Uncharacterized protein n=1 Tax=Rhynchosporium secalis TaxID=38038 RepID=A0A1E1MEQ5_RHYSE|nr:uncharacterized protein RSE6_08161 [Rhynchosporium secalis]
MAPAKAFYKKPCVGLNKIAPNPITARKVKNEKLEKQIFRGLTMSSAGILKNVKGETSLEEISRWINYHGGTYEKEVTNDTTHLICSIEEYKKGGTQVRKAWKLGTEKCQIVVFDWIEDCLQRKPKRLLKEKPYSLDRTIMNLKKMGAEKIREHRKNFEDGVRVSRELSNSNLYHIYYDTEAFEYKVMLSRIRLDGKIMIEKYTLYLFESHNKFPPIYMFGAKLSRSHRPITYYRQDCQPMTFADAFRCFQKFFKEKTGIDWDDRLERIIPRRIENGKEIEFAFFKYLPPINGRPVGLLPYGYVRPEYRQAPIEGAQIEDVGYDTDSEVGDDDQVSDDLSNKDYEVVQYEFPGNRERSINPGDELNVAISISSDGPSQCSDSDETLASSRDTPSQADSLVGMTGGLPHGAVTDSSHEGNPWRDDKS